jgi:hypothetical protein
VLTREILTLAVVVANHRLFSASVGLVAVFLLRLGAGPEMFGTNLDALLGYGGLVAATVPGLRVIVAVTHDTG